MYQSQIPDVRRMQFEIRDLHTHEVLEQGEITYTVGVGDLHPCLESRMADATVGEVRRFQITPEEGWGLRDERQLSSFPPTMFALKEPPRPGMRVALPLAGGKLQKMQIAAVFPDKIVCDLNHPLAGRTLLVQAKRLLSPPIRPTSYFYDPESPQVH